MTRHHLIAWPVGIAAILALVAVFALGHYFTYRNLPELAVQPAPGLTLTETAAQPGQPLPPATGTPAETRQTLEANRLRHFANHHPAAFRSSHRR